MFLSFALKRVAPISLILGLQFSFALTFSAVRNTSAATREPARIVFASTRSTLGPGQSASVSAKVLDVKGYEITGVPVFWKVTDGSPLVIISPSFGPSSTVTLTAKASGYRGAFVTLRATTGPVSASLVLPYTSQVRSSVLNHAPSQVSEPYSIRLSEKEINLPVGSKRVITADVNDRYGNRINGANVRWQLASAAHEKFVMLGQQINSYSTNSLEIAWGAGAAGLEVPSQVPLVVQSGQATTLLLVNYEPVAQEKLEITFDKPNIEIRPGEAVPLTVTVRGKDEVNLTNKVKLAAEFTSKDAQDVIKIVQDKNVFTLTGLNPTPGKTLAQIPAGLIVRVVGTTASKSVPVNYVRDPIVVSYGVLPSNIVADLYGRTIKKDYYCMEVTIQNYSGSDLALAALSFEPEGGLPSLPNTSYSTVHGSLAHRRLTHPRALTLAVIKGVGMLLTGFNPFFHNVNHAKNYSQFVDIISNPLEKGTELVWPDSYPGEMERFQKPDVLREDKIVKDGEVLKTKIFFPKRALFKNSEPNRDDPQKVREALGNLVVYGYKFQRGPLRQLTTR